MTKYFMPLGFLSYIVLSCFVAAFILYVFRWRRMLSMLNRIPGPKTSLIFGNALQLNVSPRELFKIIIDEFCKYKSSISIIWLGWKPMCIIYQASAAEAILSSSTILDKSDDYDYLHPWLGTGLLTSTGNKWHRRRKLLTPAFHFQILEDFVEIFNQQSAVLVKKLELMTNEKSFDIFPYITLCTLDIILETAMGRTINAQNNSESDYVKAVYKSAEIVQVRQTRPWYHYDFLFYFSSLKKEFDSSLKILHKMSNDTIREKRKEKIMKKKPTEDKTDKDIVLGRKKKMTFMDLLLESTEDGKLLSDEDIREEVDTFMFEGHDTTAAGINWTIYLLGSYPKIQDRVNEELYSIFGESDRAITSSDLKEMKYLDCCIKEALRLFPSVPIFSRVLKRDVYIDNYKIPSGTTTAIITYKLHRDPDQFPNPEEFQPDRFLLENKTKRHPYAYVPFSAGPRNCIGQKFAQMEEKIVVGNFLRKYRVESMTKREDLKILAELILRPEDGNCVKIFKRK